MLCSKCQTENPNNSKFCSQCGNPLNLQKFIYAGFFTRFFAEVVDMMLFTILILLVTFCVGFFLGIVSFLTGLSTTSATEITDTITFYFVLMGLPGYFIFFTGKYGKTFGKKIFGIKVVREETPLLVPGLTKSLIRYTIGFIVDWISFGIGVLWQLWDPQKQALHDKIAGTIVIKPLK